MNIILEYMYIDDRKREGMHFEMSGYLKNAVVKVTKIVYNNKVVMIYKLLRSRFYDKSK